MRRKSGGEGRRGGAEEGRWGEERRENGKME